MDTMSCSPDYIGGTVCTQSRTAIYGCHDIAAHPSIEYGRGSRLLNTVYLQTVELHMRA